MSFKLAPFESLGAISYLPSIVTIALSCIILEVKRDIGQKSWFLYPLVFDAPVKGSPSEYCYAVCMKKPESRGYPMVKKIWWYINSFWHNLRTWQTDKQTHRQTPHIRQRPRLMLVSRGKNHRIFMKFCTQRQILNWMNVTWSKINEKVALDMQTPEFDRTYYLFHNAFACYKQKCQLASFDLAHPVNWWLTLTWTTMTTAWKIIFAALCDA